MFRRFLAVSVSAVLSVSLSGCLAPSEPLVDKIFSSQLSPLKIATEKVQPNCASSLLGCSNPLYDISFYSDSSVKPADVCRSVIELQREIGMVAYSVEGAAAGIAPAENQPLIDFCVAGFEPGIKLDDGSMLYQGFVLYDDGAKDGLGKVTVIQRRDDKSFVVVFSLGRDPSRIGSINFGEKPRHLTADEIENADEMQKIAAKTQQFANGLLGESEATAKTKIEDAGYSWRIAHRDGEDFALTEDYSPTRINLYIRSNHVFDATVW